MRKLLVSKSFLVLLFVFTGLHACVREQEKAAALPATTGTAKVLRSGPEQMLLQYWDNFNFGDTTALNNPDRAEQAFVDFIAALSKVPDLIKSPAITNMLSKAKRHPLAFNYFTTQYEHYLYDPNSPMRNDASYEPVLNFLLDSCVLDDASKARYQARLDLARKNKVNSRALDFAFQLPAGNESSLYATEGAFTLLFFYEPDCRHCQDAIAELRANRDFNQLVEKGKLTILAVYPGGSPTVWKDYQRKIPATWINGFDRKNSIRTEGRYDLKASPTIYLLDQDKKVILKDAEMADVALILNAKLS